MTFFKKTEQGYFDGPEFGCISPDRANSRSSGLLLFAFQSMFISIWVSLLEIAEFPDSVRRSAP